MNEQQFNSMNMKQILHCTLHLLLQRDMSLNRRIYTWFLGPDENQQQSNDVQSYFSLYTKDILIETIVDALELVSICHIEDSGKSEDNRMNIKCQSLSATWTLTKLIRMLLVLVDKPDVGPDIIELIFINYLLVVYEQVYYSIRELNPTEIQQEKNAMETMKTFHLLLDNLEPYFIWEYVTKYFNNTFNERGNCSIEQICGVIMMLLDIYNFDSDRDIQSEYLIEMLGHMIDTIDRHLNEFNRKRLALCIEMMMKILDKIQSVDVDHQSLNNRNHVDTDDITQLLDQMITQIEEQINPENRSKNLIHQYQRLFHHIIITFIIDEKEMKIKEKFQRIQSSLKQQHTDHLSMILHQYADNPHFQLTFHEHANQYISIFDDCCRLFHQFTKQSSINGT